MNKVSQFSKRSESKGLTMDNASPLLQVINTYLIWLVALIIVIVLAVGYQFILSPKIQVLLDKSQSNLPNKENTLRDLRTVEGKLVQLRRDYSALQVNRRGALDKLFAAIPDKPDFPALFVQAEYLANKRELLLLSVDISRPADPALSQRQVPAANKAGSTAEQQLEILPRNVSSLTIGMKLGPGSFETLQLYLDDLERNLRLFDIQSLAFEPFDPETLESTGFDISIKTYFKTPTSKDVTSNNQTATTTVQ